ncbi:MAG: hypothetical protein A3H97_06575 [Acidobacteria bacterium RIFCSPLOWO2_02_FULL_65_29]|nr:MAG: hypothetical protein A3H97_06575 [Acidobacteria bacterium RIFCSPLOWO2_02_FULL_65_29]
MRWYRDRAAWSFIFLRYTPWIAILNLVWEVAQLPLYTLWTEGTPDYIAFAVAHCTLGDIAIGVSALALGLIAMNAGAVRSWRVGPLIAIVTVIAAAFTIFSEWLNTVALAGWAYSPLMPTVRFGKFELGLSPVLQWLVLPALALRLALARHRS